MVFCPKNDTKSQALHTHCMYPTCKCSHWLFTECFFLSALLKALTAADTISLPQYTFNTQPATIQMLHQSFSHQRPCAVGQHCFWWHDTVSRVSPEGSLRDAASHLLWCGQHQWLTQTKQGNNNLVAKRYGRLQPQMPAGTNWTYFLISWVSRLCLMLNTEGL